MHFSPQFSYRWTYSTFPCVWRLSCDREILLNGKFSLYMQWTWKKNLISVHQHPQPLYKNCIMRFWCHDRSLAHGSLTDTDTTLSVIFKQLQSRCQWSFPWPFFIYVDWSFKFQKLQAFDKDYPHSQKRIRHTKTNYPSTYCTVSTDVNVAFNDLIVCQEKKKKAHVLPILLLSDLTEVEFRSWLFI